MKITLRTHLDRLKQRLDATKNRAIAGVEHGMATAEYAIGTLAAAAFAGVLMVVVKSGGIKSALMAVIERALSM